MTTSKDLTKAERTACALRGVLLGAMELDCNSFCLDDEADREKTADVLVASLMERGVRL